MSLKVICYLKHDCGSVFLISEKKFMKFIENVKTIFVCLYGMNLQNNFYEIKMNYEYRHCERNESQWLKHLNYAESITYRNVSKLEKNPLLIFNY